MEKLKLSKIPSGVQGEDVQRRNLPPRNLRGSLLLGPRSRLNSDIPAKEENVLFKRTM